MEKTLVFTREQSRDVDRRAIEDYDFTGLVLMENAGRGCVDVLETLGIDGSVIVLCGKGNNAGDGFVIARHLRIRGYQCQVVLLAPAAELRGDAAANFKILEKTGGSIVNLSSKAQSGAGVLKNELARLNEGAAWIVDALLGTGVVGEPRPPLDTAIEWMNDQSAKKLAVDVPSGLDCDSGEPAKRTVRADHTCTFVAMKAGFTRAIAKPFTGEVHVCDIGVPTEVLRTIAPKI
ncbi:MAG TPA: NAD(P)H-hydrate epimerase [Lacipirellulaceae bacterium]|jgi:NAD(P)H-hydrate epimerase|nr:NAD(P)H-hydrate epimerase [Lacipirellulaceae bacterium]